MSFISIRCKGIIFLRLRKKLLKNKHKKGRRFFVAKSLIFFRKCEQCGNFVYLCCVILLDNF